MTFNIGIPQNIAASSIDFTNIAEPSGADYTTLWIGATTYAAGATVYSATSHHNYVSAQASNTNHDPSISTNVPTWWIDAGATNKFRPFDQILSNQCTSTSNIRFRLTSATSVIAQTVALFGLTGRLAGVRHIDTGVSKRNLITYSEDTTNAAWASAGLLALQTNQAQDAWGGWTANTVTENGSLSTHVLQYPSFSFVSGTTYTISAYVQRYAVGATRDVQLRFAAASFSSVPNATFNLTTLGITNAGGGTGAITTVGNYYKITLTAVADISAASRAALHLYNGSITYTGNSVSGVLASHFEIYTGSAVATYQWIEDATRWGDVLFGQMQTIVSGYTSGLRAALFTGLNSTPGDYIDVTIVPEISSGNAGVAEIVIAAAISIGDMEYAPSLGLVDYSTKTYDTFGNAVLIKRTFSRTVDYKIRILLANVGAFFDLMAYYRATPILFYDDMDTSLGLGLNGRGLMVYGWYTSFNIVETKSPILTISATGLS